MNKTSRQRTPTVIQMEAVECGAAALAIVLGYFGRIVPLEELRLECGVSRDGSKASNIVRAARKYGLLPRAFRKEPADLRAMNMPAIVFWNFNHFLVVEGFGKDKVFLNDPACGPRTVSWSDFDKAFTGVVMTFERGPEFQEGGRKPSIIKSLGERLRTSRGDLLYVVSVGLILVLPGMILPAFTRVFIDHVLISSEKSWLRPMLILMGAVIIIQAALSWLQQHYLLRLETKLALQTSSKFFWHVLRLPAEFFSQRFGGEIATRVGINDQVAVLLSGQLATSVLGCFTAAFYLFLLLQYDALLTLVGIVIACLNAAVLILVSRSRKDATQQMLQEMGKLAGTAIGGLQNIETLKATGSEGTFFTRWAGFHAKALRAKQSLAVYDEILTAAPPALIAINTALILAIGGYQVMAGQLTIGSLAAFQTLMASFLLPITGLVAMGSMLQQAEGDMKRLDDVLDYPEASGVTGHVPCPLALAGRPRLSGRIELRNVTFGYSRLEAPLIENFSLVIEPGQRVALAGRSGSGKSTISKLLSGLYEPWSGEILFDGFPRSQIPRALLVASVGMVDQEIFLFSGTVRDNLSMWDGTVPEPRILRAAKNAEIHEMISTRPGNYDSQVDESGGNFSGGQRQRLEIARALTGEPSILILDEATSALDPITEQLIDQNLRRSGCTCIIIAHRLSTIRDSDQIVVLSQGKVVERGRHEELIALEGAYARLIQD